jgi:serine/threonine protein kinase
LQIYFPGFEVLSLVGGGAMGTVYKARQLRLNRFVAIKVLKCPSGEDDDFGLRFEREAQVMARLSHPHIVTIHDSGEVDRTAKGREKLYFLLMEHIDGSDLSELVRSGSLDTAQVFFLFAQICDALQYAHNEGIIHRDIKPANILVDKKGRVKVADFGLAKLLRGDETLAMGLTMSGTVMGTPHYMAPELWDASVAADHRADVYSLGVVLYEMLTGTRPVGTFPPASTVCKIDPCIDAVVARAMERDPARRFQQASEIDAAARRGETIPSRIRRPKVLAGAVMALVILLGVTAMAWGPWRSVEGKGDTVAESPLRSGSAPLAAPADDHASPSRDSPFENSLGMKFVPVSGTDLLFCIHETRWKDYNAYAAETPEVHTWWMEQSHQGFSITDQGETHPVWHVNWDDAQQFCRWLSRRENRTYRLPTDAEWSLAVGLGGREPRSGDDTPESLGWKSGATYSWGTTWPPPAGSGNFCDQSRRLHFPSREPTVSYLDGYDDGFPMTAPVMTFAPNEFGLYDMGGNVWEWVEDWMNKNHEARTQRGAAWTDGGEAKLRSAFRMGMPPDMRYPYTGFRIALAPDIGKVAETPLPAGPNPQGAPFDNPAFASKDRFYENSLGMKFVPVPGTKVLFCIHETRFMDYGTYAMESSGVNLLWKNQSYGDFMIGDRAHEHPVAHVNWNDATAFCIWLSRREGRIYRLPTDREWSVAVGLGKEERPSLSDTPATLSGKLPGVYPWGKMWPPPQGTGNYSDQSRMEKFPRESGDYLENYNDGFPTSSPVMSFPPNSFGLFDMGGNVWEWVEDWRSDSDNRRTVRGGSWWTGLEVGLTSSGRSGDLPEVRGIDRGFRIVLESEVERPSPSSALAPLAAPDAPIASEPPTKGE